MSASINTDEIFLDDVRAAPKGYVLMQSYSAFTEQIRKDGLPSVISFDHDLDEGPPGYDCAKFIVEYCLDHQLNLPAFTVHSQNPVRKENIEKLLVGFEKFQRRN